MVSGIYGLSKVKSRKIIVILLCWILGTQVALATYEPHHPETGISLDIIIHYMDHHNNTYICQSDGLSAGVSEIKQSDWSVYKIADLDLHQHNNSSSEHHHGCSGHISFLSASAFPVPHFYLAKNPVIARLPRSLNSRNVLPDLRPPILL